MTDLFVGYVAGPAGSSLSTSLASMGASVRGPGSPTTKAACRPRDTATSWSTGVTSTTGTRYTAMTSSPSPPPTMQSPSPATSAATSPRITIGTSSPVAVRAAVHRADTGQTPPPPTHTLTTSRTHSTTVRTLCNDHRSEGALDKARGHPCNKYPSQTQSQIELGTKPLDNSDESREPSPTYTVQYKSEPALPRRKIWQRSASCRDLYDFSFEDSGQAKSRKSNQNRPAKPPLDKSYTDIEERKLESPITRYDDSNRALYSATSSHNVSLEICQDIIVPGQKVYSSSYPGTTSLSQESMEDPGNYELAESQDDLSHDSYELLERSDDDYSTSGADYRHRKTKSMNTRSCSLDSGNYLPTDSESDSETKHKYKSSNDVQDIFMMDDPRDFPREKIPRKSDGSFYKNYKISSRTSSLESKSDYYDTKPSKTQSKDNLRKNWDKGSRTSSQESKSDYENKKAKSETRIIKSYENIGIKTDFIDSRASSLESKSDYYDANSKIDEPIEMKYQYDRKIQFERNYGVQKPVKADYSFPSFQETSHVHSISLQNVETEQNIRSKHIANLEQNTVPRTHKSTNYGRSQTSYEPEYRRSQPTHIWPEALPGVPTEITEWPTKMKSQRSTESESNIFSFDEEKIQSLQESDMELGMTAQHSSYSIVSAMNKNNLNNSKPTRNSHFRDVFLEIDGTFPMHQPIERTKSDPNSIANRQRLGSNSRRHMLMHQKSIDLTPAESSDEDYLFKQIPSAPPITKYRGTHFEMPTAEFGHFDILKREGQKTKFEVPKSQFEVLGAKTQSDLVNLPPKNDFDIPYVLHKRHMMNGTSKTDPKFKEPEPVIVESSTMEKWKSEADSSDEGKSSVTLIPPPPDPEPSSFLFTQNIDLSKIDPITLEIDKSEPPIQHMASPKRDITKIDPSVMEALSSKLSQIESDSPTSSKTESLKPELKTVKLQKVTENEEEQKIELKISENEIKAKQVLKEKLKSDLKPKRIIKARMQPNKKGGKNKTKVRITSFSSDDESLDSDDVFGTAEATPTKLEFSPPQSRKEMEPILKYESERQTHLQYTMSSTEIEGSPPQTRKTEYLPYERSLDPNYQTELRRISERSISIPSSEEDLKGEDLNRPVFDPVQPPVIEEETKTISEDVTLELTEGHSEIPTDTVVQNTLPSKDLMDGVKLDIKEMPITGSESPMITRKKGQSPLLFAHARLNLSEGSAFSLIQKQTAATSPTASRRAKSLDAPVISVSKLPPLNAFSSKDDTVEESAEIEIENSVDETKLELKQDGSKEPEPETKKEVKSPPKSEKKVIRTNKSQDKDQIVPDVVPKPKKTVTKSSSKTITTQRSFPADKDNKTKTVTSQRSLPLQKTGKDTLRSGMEKEKASGQKTLPSKNVALAKMQKPPLPKSKSSKEKTVAKQKSDKPTLTSQQTLQPPEIVRAKSQEMEGTKRVIPKEKSKSFEKLEFKRTNSKERAKSQEDSDSDIAKRIEKQQMLYETAIKQTKTLKSPVKDALPVFPTVEETVRVNDGKLEISIDTIENSNIPLEEAIIITKSPKKLDKKLTKSLELNLTADNIEDTEDKSVKRLGKSLDLEPQDDDSKEFDFKPEKIKAVEESFKKLEELQLPPPVVETSPESDGVTEQVIEAEVHKEPLGSEFNEDVVLEGTTLDVWLSVDQKPKNDKLSMITVIQKGDENVFFEDVPEEKPPDPKHLKSPQIEEGEGLKSSSSSSESEKVKGVKVKPPEPKDHKLSSDSQSSEKVKLSKIKPSELKDGCKSSSDSQSTDKTKLFKEKIFEPKEIKDAKSSSESHSLEKASLGNSLDIKYIDESGDSSHKSEKDAKLIAELQKSIAIDSNLSKKIEKIIKNSQDNKTVEREDNTLVRITSEDESLTEVSELRFETADSHLLGFTEQSKKDSLLKLSIERSRSEETVSWVTVECDEYVGTDSFDVEETSEKAPDSDTARENIKQSVDEDSKPILLEPKKVPLRHSSDHSRSSDTTGSWTSGEKDLSPGNVKETGDESSVSCSIAKTIGISQNIEKFESLEQARTGDESLGKSHKLERSSPIDEESSSASNGFTKPREPGTVSEEGSIKKKYPFEQKWGSDSELSQRIHKKITKKLSSADKNSVSSLDDSLSDKRWNGMGSLDRSTLQSLDKLSVDSRNSFDTESSSGSLGVAARLQKAGEIPVREPTSTWRPFLIESSGSSSLEEGFLPPDQDLDNTQEYFLSRQPAGEFSGHYETAVRPEKEEETYDFQDELSEFPTNFGYPCLTAAIGGIGIGSTDMLAYGSGFLARTLSRISERSTNSENTSLEDDSTKASTQSDSVNDESLMSSDHQASLSSDSPSGQPERKPLSLDKKLEKQDSSGNSKQSPEQNIININNLLLQRQMSDDRRTSAEMADLSIDDIEIITSERGLKLKRQDSDDTIIDEENEMPCLRPSGSQDSEGDWPLPEIPIRMHPEMKLYPNIPKSFGLPRGSLKSQDSEQWPSPPSSLLETPVVDNVESYYMNPPEEACKVTVDSNTDPYDSSEENKTLGNDEFSGKQTVDDEQETREDFEKISSNSDSISGGRSGVRIILETKSADSHSSNSEDLNVTLNDDVFTDAIIDTSKNELRPPTVLRRSTTSDDSSKGELKPPSPRHSHSSYSEEECTSSMGTNFEEGTVRFALRPAKCTHSSHSEDTSVALSLSEWSNSTNTVKFQNLSSNNSVTNKSNSTNNSSGVLKSDDNSITEMAQSISEWSSSNSNTLVAQTSSLQFQKLSTNTTSTGDSNTLTEMIPTISDWSSSDTTIVAQEYNVNTINIEGCLEQLLEDEESVSVPKSPENIPSEDHCFKLEDKLNYTKSTERPVTFTLSHLMSDTESTSSAREPPRQHSLKSTERPVRVPIKFSKCSPYYSSSLSSESASAAISKPINIKTATIPLTRTHRKSLPKNVLQAKSPPSENDSTSSVESPIGTPEARVRGYRRRRQVPAKRHKLEKERSLSKDEYSEPERFMCGKDFSDLPSDYEYKSDIIRRIYSENVEEGYFPDGDSQSGSDVFRIENDCDFEDGVSKFDSMGLDGSLSETFDVSSIPPPLLEDDFEDPDDPNV